MLLHRKRISQFETQRPTGQRGDDLMSDYTLVGELPRHRYVWVDSRFTHHKPIGFIPAVWYGLVSLRGRVWGCTVMLECGAVYRNLPPHAIAFRSDPSTDWSEKDAQRWDAYGERFSVIEYTYLAGLEAMVSTDSGSHIGEYLFTVAPVKDGYSMVPEQAKEFKFFALRNGRLTIQPTNYVLFHDRSFTTNDEFKPPEGLKCQVDAYSCEGL
jgi:hypothetical protein